MSPMVLPSVVISAAASAQRLAPVAGVAFLRSGLTVDIRPVLFLGFLNTAFGTWITSASTSNERMTMSCASTALVHRNAGPG